MYYICAKLTPRRKECGFPKHHTVLGELFLYIKAHCQIIVKTIHLKISRRYGDIV